MKTQNHLPGRQTSIRRLIWKVSFVLGDPGLLAITASLASASPPDYSFAPVVFLGSPAPGGGAFVNDFEPTRFNNRGQLVFTAEPVIPGEEAVFLAGGGTMQQIMRFSLNPPGSGTTFSTFELAGDEQPGIGKIVSLEQGGSLICCPPVSASAFPLCGPINNDHGQSSFAATVLSSKTVNGVLLIAILTGAQ